MLTTLRATLAVVMLFGFYVFAFAIIGGLGWLTVMAFGRGMGVAGSKLGYVTIAVAVGILAALWRVIRARPEPPSGLPVSPQQAPELWGIVTELAAQLKTRRPDQILLVPDVNAAVTEDARLLGLLGGRRTLLLGVPLLQAFSVAQLRSVLAHELGHYSGSHTRLGPITYRGRIAIIGTVANLSGFIAWLFKVYARIYLLVEAAVSRRQELEADRASVQVAGREAAQSALRELPVIVAAWNFYFGQYVAPGWEAGYAPDDIFGGFGELLRHRSGELAQLRAGMPPDKGSVWDSHPPIAARIQAMEAMPDRLVTVDDRPATELIPGFPQACAALASRALKIGSRQVLPWDQFTAAAMTATAQDAADEIYRGVARSTGSSDVNLGTVLDLSAAGRLGTVGGPLTEAPADALGLLVSLAAVRSGVATWRHSWAGPATLVRPDGSAFDVGEIVRLAVSPATAEAARARLAELGIDTAKASLVQATATAKGSDVVGGIANMKVDGAWHDVLILTNGLILAPGPKSTDGGKNRLHALATSAPVEQLARRYRFLAFEDVASVTVLKEVPVRLEVGLHDGRTVKLEESWTGDLLTKQCRDNLVAGLRSRLPHGAAEPESTWSK
ncbi:MAG: M48 family metallopeptidase [Micromonosporaceae bacterium]|nr:M48 family metallopeptidase [Micromonosporaceae bacterium]